MPRVIEVMSKGRYICAPVEYKFGPSVLETAQCGPLQGRYLKFPLLSTLYAPSEFY